MTDGMAGLAARQSEKLKSCDTIDRFSSTVRPPSPVYLD